MKIGVFLTFFIILSVQAQSLLTLEEAIRTGLENNFDIQIARHSVQIADNTRGLGTAGFLPTLDVQGGAQYIDSKQESNSPFSFGNSQTKSLNGQVLLNWTVFDGFRMFVANTRYNRLADLGEAQARTIIENSVVAILVAYFDLVQQQQLLEVARNTLEISETRLNKEKVRRDIGGASSTDFLNAQVSYNNDKATLINQELRVQVALKDLNLLLGQKPDTPLQVEQEIKIPPVTRSFEELLELAWERNSVLVVAQQNKAISQQDVKLAQSNFLPRLSVGSSYSYLDRTISGSPRFDGDIESTSKDGLIGLNLSWNLFNGFRNKIELQNSRIEAKNSELVYQDIRNQIEGLLREVHQTFYKRLELIDLEEQNVVAARQNLQLQQDRYDIGGATFLEYRDAQVNLNRAQITLIVARFQSRITRLEIERLTGNLELN